MNASEAVQMLRHAVAAIWTELESDAGSPESAQTIADEALELTAQFAPAGKDLTNQEIGIESWRQFRAKRGMTRECEG